MPAFPSAFKKSGGGRIFQEPAASPSEIELLQDAVAGTKGVEIFRPLQGKRLYFDQAPVGVHKSRHAGPGIGGMPLSSKKPTQKHFLSPISIVPAAKSRPQAKGSALSFRASSTIRSQADNEAAEPGLAGGQLAPRNPEVDSDLRVPSPQSELDTDRPPSNAFALLTAQYASPYFGSKEERNNRGSAPDSYSPRLTGRRQQLREKASPRGAASGTQSGSVASVVIAVSRRTNSRGNEDNETEEGYSENARKPNRRGRHFRVQSTETHEPSPSYALSQK